MIKKIIHHLYALPLRAHLLMMAFLLALPAIVLIIQSGMTQRAESMRKGFSEARRLTNAIAKEQYNLSGNAEQLLMALEQIPEIEKRDKAATSAILSAILHKNPQYANIIVADQHGNVWASGLPMAASFSIKDRRLFQQAVRTRGFSSGDFGIGRISRKATIGFGYPIINKRGDLVGVVAANINFEQFKVMLPVSSLPGGSSYSIIDRNGVIVSRNLNPEKYVGTRLRDDYFFRMQNGRDKETFIAEDLGNVEKIVSYRKLTLHEESSPYLYVRTAFPLEKVMEKAQRALLTNVAVLSSLLLAAVLSVFHLGNVFFVKRIERLDQAAHRMAEGDLEVRVSHDEGGEIGHLGAVFDDMARKLAARQATLVKSEHDLHELNQTLLKRVEVETERRVNHERLLARHARLVAMGEMIGAIAHQWRQPLATLGATIQSIRMAWDHGCLDDAFLKRAEQDAQKQLYYMSDTIEDFRNFFTPDKVAEKFDIKAKIAEVVLLVSPQFSHSGVTLETEDLAQKSRLCVMGYQNEFKQSLLNLVSNAFDSIVEKSARLLEGVEAVEEKGTVVISMAWVDDKVVVEVRDNGCGIAAEHADKVFDPYFTTKSGDKGTGIGLYMTKLIIEESMEGDLSFTSGPEGTVFRMELARDDSANEVVNG